MQRPIAQIVLAFLLAASSLAILRVSATIGSRPPGGASPAATQTVRAYVAGLNEFLDGGDMHEIERLLAPDFTSTTPPFFSSGDNNTSQLPLLAFRSTFPDLRFEVTELSTSVELVIAQISATDGVAALPSWLNGGTAPARGTSVDAFRIEDELIVEQLSSAPPAVLAHTVPAAEVQFRLDRTARVTISRLRFSGVESSSQYAVVPGPGFVLPQQGAFRVTGNGLLRIATLEDSRTRLIPVGDEVTLGPDQLLVIPRGKAMLYSDGDQASDLLLLSAIPIEPDRSHDREMDRGYQPVDGLEDALRKPPGELTALWFGSTQVLASAESTIEPGWLAMDLGWVFLPPGERLTIVGGAGHTAMLDLTDDRSTAEPSDDRRLELRNAGADSALVAIVRATPVGDRSS